MAWNSTAPDGTQSVKDNKTILQDNTTYTETYMNKDHFWNIGADEDGHHQFVQMPKSESGGTPTNPTLATGMNGVIYTKEKTSVESPTIQNILPYFKDGLATPSILEMLGIRACCSFSGRSTPGACTILYSHNTAAVTRGSAGIYTVGYTTALPSNNYLVYGAGAYTQAVTVIIGAYSTLITEVKSTTGCRLVVTNLALSLVDPTQGFFFCFGG